MHLTFKYNEDTCHYTITMYCLHAQGDDGVRHYLPYYGCVIDVDDDSFDEKKLRISHCIIEKNNIMWHKNSALSALKNRYLKPNVILYAERILKNISFS